MFNLLPENLRKTITTEYRLRLAILAIVMVVLVQISFLIFLFPSWLVSYYKERDFSVQSDELNKSLSTLDISSTTAFIKSFNTKIGIINDSLEYPKFVPMVDEVIAKKTSSIRISGIYYTVNSANAGTLTLEGLGDTRESLVSFSDSLKTIQHFKKVDLPISNLAKDKNISFIISINVEN
jgi:hypothetical protein